MFAAPVTRPLITMWRDEDDIDTVTFGEFIRSAQGQAADFVAQGVVPGDTVILVMPQGIPLMTSFAAAMIAGAVPGLIRTLKLNLQSTGSAYPGFPKI